MFDDILIVPRKSIDNIENREIVICPNCGYFNLEVVSSNDSKVTFYCINCNFLWASD